MSTTSQLRDMPLGDRLRFVATWLQRTVRLGVKALWLHRLRSLLTMLGIVFGVCSVIAMLAIGEGASYEAQQQIKQLGSNNIILRSVKPPENNSNTEETSRSLEYGITYDDVSRIKATIPGVTVVVPARIVRMDVWNRARRVDCDIHGTVPWYPEMRNHPVAKGRYFSSLDMDTKNNVCVLGADMADQMFPFGGAIGQRVRVGSSYYYVIGIMERKGGSEDDDNPAASANARKGAAYAMYIPLSAARARFGETTVRRSSGSFEMEKVELHEVTIKVANLEAVVETSLIITEILNATHSKIQDFEIVVPLQLLRQAERTKQIFNIVLGAIAAISLLVGGIGIMNIMLASVTERTREIGIRRALGAKRRDIILQFLVETVLLSATGGFIGVIIGVAIPAFITYFAEMQTIVTLFSPIMAFTISALIGVVFGIYPAFRAAYMDPVEALRHE